MRNNNFIELRNDELKNINGGAWILLAKVAVWLVVTAVTAIVGYYAIDAVQGIEDGLGDGECTCD